MKSAARSVDVSPEPLSAQLAAVKEDGRGAVLACVKAWLASQQQRLKQRFLESGDVTALLAGHTQAIDTLIVSLFNLNRKKTTPSLALLAVGGYGRGELFPYSDIDLLFLHDKTDAKEAARIAEYILYMLWDLGLTVGQSHRTSEETLQLAREDITVRTTLLDARFLIGDRAVFETFQRRFKRDVIAGSALEFVEAKLTERDERHRRFGDSRYVLEPNVKEGKGGLRDLHTLWWLACYNYPIGSFKDLVKMGLLTREEYRVFDRARQFLCKVRAHLHYLAGRAEERLAFDRQHALAAAMGYSHANPNRAVERFMRRYFAAVRMVGEATRVFCALLEDEKKRKPRTRLGWLTLAPWKLGRFQLDGERLNLLQAKAFERQPIQMLELFRTSQVHGLDIHPRALQLVARNLRRINRRLQHDARANALFLDILLDQKRAEATLRKMSDAGVLGRFIPDFGRIIGQTQFNMYHIYTVDEHTLVAIGILHAIENGALKDELPLATSLTQRIKLRRVLYTALLCHDIAKGRRGDHSDAGASVALRMAQRFGFSKEEADTTAWLVKHHLLVTHTAFKRDLNDPKTIQDFVATVQSSERLKLLLLLTIADMRAVGASIWNAWKASLIEELYIRAEQAIGTGHAPLKEAQGGPLRAALLKALPGWQEEEIDAYLEQATPGFLSGLETAQHAVIARMLKQAAGMQLPLLIDTQHDYERATTEITLCAPDQPGLFSKLAGALSLAGANIIGAKIFTLKNGIAIDIFQVQDAAADVFDRPDRLAKMSVYIEQALSGEMDFAKAFTEKRKNYGRSRRDAHPVAGQVFVENDASNIHTVVEITGHDRVGFLYQVTKTISDLGLSISSAHISTYGTQVADVFYVKNQFGMKISHEAKIRELREALLVAVNNPVFA